MKRRREHGECERRLGGRGCLVFGTPVCKFRRRGRWEEWREVGRKIAEALWVLRWIIVVMLGIVLAWGRMHSGLDAENLSSSGGVST